MLSSSLPSMSKRAHRKPRPSYHPGYCDIQVLPKSTASVRFAPRWGPLSQPQRRSSVFPNACTGRESHRLLCTLELYTHALVEQALNASRFSSMHVSCWQAQADSPCAACTAVLRESWQQIGCTCLQDFERAFHAEMMLEAESDRLRLPKVKLPDWIRTYAMRAWQDRIYLERTVSPLQVGFQDAGNA